jgi:hypothetical protein
MAREIFTRKLDDKVYVQWADAVLQLDGALRSNEADPMVVAVLESDLTAKRMQV